MGPVPGPARISIPATVPEAGRVSRTPEPARISIPPTVPEAGRVSRAPDPDRVPKLTGTEVARAAFGLKVLYDCADAEVEYALSPFLAGDYDL